MGPRHAAGQQGRGDRFWHKCSLEQSEKWANKAHRQTIAFSHGNLFIPPTCNATKGLIEEKTLLMRAYINSSPIAAVALKTVATTILPCNPHLICQRTHPRSRHSHNVKALHRCLELWRMGKVDQLLGEAWSIQKRMHNTYSKKERTQDRAGQFADKMRQGQVKWLQLPSLWQWMAGNQVYYLLMRKHVISSKINIQMPDLRHLKRNCLGNIILHMM